MGEGFNVGEFVENDKAETTSGRIGSKHRWEGAIKKKTARAKKNQPNNRNKRIKLFIPARVEWFSEKSRSYRVVQLHGKPQRSSKLIK